MYILTVVQIECRSCGTFKLKAKDSGSVEVSLHDTNKSVDLQTCIDDLSSSQQVRCKCEDAGRSARSLKVTNIKKLQDHAFVNIHRGGSQKSAETEKIPTKVAFPKDPINMGASIDNLYEPIAVLERKGESIDPGHWTCAKKVEGQWWLFDDDKIAKLSDEELKERHGAAMVLLRRMTQKKEFLSRRKSSPG